MGKHKHAKWITLCYYSLLPLAKQTNTRPPTEILFSHLNCELIFLFSFLQIDSFSFYGSHLPKNKYVLELIMSIYTSKGRIKAWKAVLVLILASQKGSSQACLLHDLKCTPLDFQISALVAIESHFLAMTWSFILVPMAMWLFLPLHALCTHLNLTDNLTYKVDLHSLFGDILV